MGKQYYLATKFLGDKIIRDIWHCSHSTIVAIAKSYDVILPLDRKPRGCADVREGA